MSHGKEREAMNAKIRAFERQTENHRSRQAELEEDRCRMEGEDEGLDNVHPIFREILTQHFKIGRGKMHTLVEEKVADLNVKIAQALATDDDIKIAEEIIPDAKIWIDYEVNVGWAVSSMGEVKDVLAKFAKLGIMLDKYTASNTQPIWHLNGKKVKIRLSPIWSKNEGAACRLVQIGEDVRSYPIYKLVCDEKETA